MMVTNTHKTSVNTWTVIEKWLKNDYGIEAGRLFSINILHSVWYLLHKQ